MPWVPAPDEENATPPQDQPVDQTSQAQGGWQPAPPDAQFVPHTRQSPGSDLLKGLSHMGDIAANPSHIIGKDSDETTKNVALMASPFVGGAVAQAAAPVLGKVAMQMRDMFKSSDDPEGQETMPPATTSKQQAEMDALKNVTPARKSADEIQRKLLTDANINPHTLADRTEAGNDRGLPMVALDHAQADDLGDPTSADNILSMVAAAGNKPGQAQLLSRGLIRRGDMQRQQIKSQLEDVLSGDSTSGLNDQALMQMATKGKALQDEAFMAGSSGEPITSPRLQEMIKDPIIQQGIKYGIRTQQIRSLGNPLEPFEPNDYGVVGYDPNGDLIVSEHPNMRALDAGRKGLRSLIQNEVSSNNGRFTERAGAMSEAASNLTDELTRLNPKYGEYLKTVGDPLHNQSMMEHGRDFTNMRPEEITDLLQGNATRFKAGLTPKLHEPASEGGQQYFKAGAMEHISDQLADSKDDASVLDKVWKQKIRDRLAPMVGPEGMETLNQHMQDQRAMMRSNRAFGGSNTFDKFAANELLKDSTQTPALAHAAEAGRFVTHPVRATTDFLSRMAQDKVDSHVDKMSNETAAELMKDYASRDPTVWRDLGNRLGIKPEK